MIFNHPLYFVSTLTGLCVFNSKGQFSSILALYSFAVLCVVCSVGLYYRIYLACIHSNYFEFDIFSHGLPTLSLFAKVLTCSIHLFVSVIRRRDFEIAFKTFRFKKNNLPIVFWAAFGSIGSSAIYGFQFVRISKWEGTYMAEYEFPHRIDSACVVCLTTLCYYINLQFCCLLQAGKSTISDLIIRLTGGDLFTENRHLKVVEALVRTNRLYGIQTLLNCFQSFSYLLTNAYFLSTFEDFEFWPEPEYRRALECHVVFSMAMFYQMAYFCSETETKIWEFNKELFKTVRGKPELLKNERMKLCVLQGPSVEFNACGFIRIGYPLISSVLAATVTYAVILVQSGIN